MSLDKKQHDAECRRIIEQLVIEAKSSLYRAHALSLAEPNTTICAIERAYSAVLALESELYGWTR